jgi:hypothetical protein
MVPQSAPIPDPPCIANFSRVSVPCPAFHVPHFAPRTRPPSAVSRTPRPLAGLPSPASRTPRVPAPVSVSDVCPLEPITGRKILTTR